MHCGTMLAQATTQMQPQAVAGAPVQAMPLQMPMATNKRRAGRWGIIVGILVVAAIAFGLNASGILGRFGSDPGSKSLQAKGSQGDDSALQAMGTNPDSNALSAQGAETTPSILQAQGSQGSPILPATADRKQMPDDVRRWLEHLERIEKKRIDMTQDQLAAAIMQMTELQLGGSMSDLQKLLDDGTGETTQDNIDTAREAVNTFEGNRQKWVQLNDEFLGVPAPAECVQLRNEYDKVLRETGAMIMEICQAVENAESDRQGALKTLMKMQGSSDARIGRPARGSDRMLGEICSKYDTRKWFSITSDVGSNAMGKFGL